MAKSYNPAADGERAARTDAAVMRALRASDVETLTDIALHIGFDEFTRRYPVAARLLSETADDPGAGLPGWACSFCQTANGSADRHCVNCGRRRI